MRWYSGGRRRRAGSNTCGTRGLACGSRPSARCGWVGTSDRVKQKRLHGCLDVRQVGAEFPPEVVEERPGFNVLAR